MEVYVAKDYNEMSSRAADLVEALYREKPDARLGLATGSTPLGLYQEMARRCGAGRIDFSKACSVNLDEYVGLAPEHPQSYRRFMDENLFDHINIDKKNTYVALGTGDLEKNLREFQAVLDSRRTDLQVLGIGVDGHIGFNEPGSVLYGQAHLETLTPSTIEANKRFFEKKDDVPRKAVTMGLKNIMQARRIIVLVTGLNKKDTARQLLMTDEVSTSNPVTLVRLHPNVTVFLDRELADAVGYRG
jgi:glucosamine-6-phosphate deaminase